jgi:hypothetical protein
MPSDFRTKRAAMPLLLSFTEGEWLGLSVWLSAKFLPTYGVGFETDILTCSRT